MNPGQGNWRAVARSTTSLVGLRTLGVGARYLALMCLSALLPVADFAICALAFAISEFARVASDGGIDVVYLRRAESMDESSRQTLGGQALFIKLAQGSLALLVVAMIVRHVDQVGWLATLIACQFLAQALTQLALNLLQTQGSVARRAQPLMVVYLVVLGLAVAGSRGQTIGFWAFPVLLAGELAFGVWIASRSVTWAGLHPLRAYASYYPVAFSMAGVGLLAMINTRADALITSALLTAEEAGRYMYLSRWVDAAPMMAGGIAMPLVGKIRNVTLASMLRPWVVGPIAALLAAPFVVAAVVTHFGADYAAPGVLPWLLASTSALRVGLVLSTAFLLSHWRDASVFWIAVVTSLVIVSGGWIVGRSHGAVGIALVVLAVEACNLGVQLFALRRYSRSNANANSGT